MNGEELKVSLETYRLQLSQVESVLVASGTEQNEDLVTLQGDLQELINLTQDSLLSLEKSKLLSLVDETLCGNGASENTTTTGLDEELLAFQKAISGDAAVEDDNGGYSVHAGSSTDIPGDQPATDDDFTDVTGTKCNVPVHCDWGPDQHHNAMIVGVESGEEEEPKVRVLFCNPTDRTMLPCPYYLEDKCRFKDGDCRYSHGYLVDVDKLEEFVEPDHSLLTVGASCLAKDTDDLWYKATVVDLPTDDKYHVMYSENQAEDRVGAQDIIPAPEQDEASSVDSGSESPTASCSNDQVDEDFPVMLWQPQTNEMGQWESCTKGIGSKLMQRMGYVSGDGLGKNKDGRVEPVPIQLLPSGKSLDKIMELKALAGDQNLYDVLKQQKHKQKRVEQRAANAYNRSGDQKGVSVFDFINKKIGHKKGNIHELANKTKANSGSKKSNKTNHISERELSTRSDHHINVQMLKTHDEIKGVENELVRLKARLGSNNGKDPGLEKQLSNKISSMEKYLDNLRASERSMNTHKQNRSDHKKLTVF